MAFPDPTNIGVVQNATFQMTVNWATSEATPQPIDMTDYRARMQIRTKTGGIGQLMVDLSDSIGGLLIQPEDEIGRLDIYIGAEQTALLKKALYFYDLFIIKRDDAGEAVRLAYGTVTLFKSVTVTPTFVPDFSGVPSDDLIPSDDLLPTN